MLVVDDDSAFTRLVTLVLREEGYRVAAAHNGAEALTHLPGFKPDVILLDLQMPVMDGRTFFIELRARQVSTPVMIVSVHEARLARIELGADAYLNKPFDPDQLVDAVRALVGR